MRSRRGGERSGSRRLHVLAAALAVTAAAVGGGGAGYAAPGAKPPTVCAEGCAYTSIQAAVDAAAPGATITIGRGVFAGGITIDKDLTLIGAGAKKTVVAGPADGTVIEAVSGDIGLQRLTITGGATGVGLSFFPRVTVEDSIISGNEWGTRGFGGALTVRRTLVTGNDVAGVGPIFSGSATVEDSTIARNGAGIMSDSRMTVVVRDSRILDNTNSGILMLGGTLEVYGSTIRGNTGLRGGGIALWVGRAGATATVVDTTIRHNTATEVGGGIYIDILSNLTLQGSKVFRNTAQAGGGIYNTGEWETEPNFESVRSRIWNNRPDDYLETCDPTRRPC